MVKKTRYWGAWVIMLLGILTACTGDPTPASTPVVIVKPLATLVLSPTPDAFQRTATMSAITPTLAPATPTPSPTPTAYVGVFIGQADTVLGFQSFTEPLLAPNASQEPTPDNRRCLTPIDERLLNIWQTNRAVSRALGCPIQESYGFFGKLQIFDKGVMYLQPDIQAVWAVLPSLGVGRYEYLENPPDFSGSLSIPRDRLAPSGKFLGMWATVETLDERLGYALTPEQDVALGIQRFDGGTFLIDGASGQAFALIADGTVLGAFTLPQLLPVTITPSGN